MKEKRYSITEIQQIIDISPNDLQKLIRKNSSRIKLKTCDLPDGSKETFLDEDSFKKLLFIKQLEMGTKLSVDEVCAMIREKKIKQEDEEDKSEKISEISGLDLSLQSLEDQVDFLRRQLNHLIIRHDHCIKELNLSRSKGVVLENELKRMKNREAALMGQLRKFAAEHSEDEICVNEVN